MKENMWLEGYREHPSLQFNNISKSDLQRQQDLYCHIVMYLVPLSQPFLFSFLRKYLYSSCFSSYTGHIEMYPRMCYSCSLHSWSINSKQCSVHITPLFLYCTILNKLDLNRLTTPLRQSLLMSLAF